MARLESLAITLFVIFVNSVFCQENNEKQLVATYQHPFVLSCDKAVATEETVTWYKDSVVVEAKENVYQISQENKTLTIVKMEPKVYGKYSCSFSTGEEKFNISVFPYVTQFDKSRNVIQGDPLKLECKTWGVPEPKVTWYHNDKELTADSAGKIEFKSSGSSSGDGFPEVQNGTIRIVEMDYEQKGNYSCRVVNTINNVLQYANASVEVQVKDKYAALWPFLGICVEVAVLCTIILIYERRRAKRIEEEERQEEAAHLNANNDARARIGGEEVRQRK